MKYSLFFLIDQYDDPHYSVSKLYSQVEQHAIMAEALGYHGIYLAEHHIHNYGLLPSPQLLLTWLAAKTNRIRLGTAVTILPLHSPLRLAEDYALLDLLSQGRLDIGLGSGFLDYEFQAFDLDVTQKRQYFDAAYLKLESLLLGEHQGPAKLNIPTYQQPIPLYVASVTPESAFHIGRLGRSIMAVPYNRFETEANAAEQILQQYYKGLESAGFHKDHGKCIMSFFTHVAETDEQARENIAHAFSRYVYARATNKAQEFLNNDYSLYDKWLEKGFLLCGSPKTVLQKLQYYKDCGLNHALTFQHFGAVDCKIVEQSMRLFAEQVIPNLK